MKKNKINIGSCDFNKEGWYTLDKASSHYSSRQNKIDFNHDLMSNNPIPLEDNSLKVAYSSHTIEHISYKYVQHMFYEMYRVLEPGGIIRITCPDMGRCYQAYLDNDEDYIFKWLLNPQGYAKFKTHGIGEQLLFIFASYLSPYRSHITVSDLGKIKKYQEDEITKIFKENTKVDALNLFSRECEAHAESIKSKYPGEHINWWDFDKIKSFMEISGFRNIQQERFNQSRNYDLYGFDQLNDDNNKCLKYTIFVEAEK